MYLVDSHCHLNFPELAKELEEVVRNMGEAGVGCALCVSVSLETLPEILEIAVRFPCIYASVGVHPNHTEGNEPTEADLMTMARHPRVVAIGETGLDYYRMTGMPERQRTASEPMSAQHAG